MTSLQGTIEWSNEWFTYVFSDTLMIFILVKEKMYSIQVSLLLGPL